MPSSLGLYGLMVLFFTFKSSIHLEYSLIGDVRLEFQHLNPSPQLAAQPPNTSACPVGFPNPVQTLLLSDTKPLSCFPLWFACSLTATNFTRCTQAMRATPPSPFHFVSFAVRFSLTILARFYFQMNVTVNLPSELNRNADRLFFFLNCRNWFAFSSFSLLAFFLPPFLPSSPFLSPSLFLFVLLCSSGKY